MASQTSTSESLASAETLLREALATCEQHFEQKQGVRSAPDGAVPELRASNLAIATAQNNLAVHLKSTAAQRSGLPHDAFAEAYKLYSDALDTRTKLLGPTHPDTITTEYNLAEVLRWVTGRIAVSARYRCVRAWRLQGNG